jgi:hypothetical protein
MRILAAAFGAGLVALSSAASAQQRPDDFAAACMKRGIRESACLCQAKIARGSLDAAERRAAIAGMTGGQAALQREIARMGEAKAKAFAAKMQRLGERAKAQCA